MSRIRRRLLRLTGGAAVFPLVVLFGLNAVDELDRTAFGVLVPNIRDAFGLDTSGLLTFVAIVAVGGILLEIPIAYWSDRLPRARIAVAGAAVWAIGSLFTGLAPTLMLLGLSRTGAGMGRAVNNPTHNSLLADYYGVDTRSGIYGFYRAASAVGAFVGPLTAGLLAGAFGWRVPFVVFVFPTLVFVLLGLRLKEPVRGGQERAAMGESPEIVATEDVAPSFAESWRIVWNVRTLRRIMASLPFLAASIAGLVVLNSLFYEQVFDLDERARGFVAAVAEPAQLVGLLVGIPLALRLTGRNPSLVPRFLALAAGAVAVEWALFALSPSVGIAIALNICISATISVIAPLMFASLSLAIPPRARSFGFAVAALWVLPGLVFLPIVGSLAEAWGVRAGLLLMVPVFLVGGLVLASAGPFIRRDIDQVWRAAAAQSEVLYHRRRGEVKLLLVRGLEVDYDGVQVLFGVDLEVGEGEIVALLGTNGAGKSTLLRAISGLAPAGGGAVIFDGRDITPTPPEEIAALGITQVPGGQGVFPSLTVRENVELAGWLRRHDRDELTARVEAVYDHFPVLRDREHEVAGNLSGGQQQMLTLGMAFIERPRLLMIDELSLGLAPSVVDRLLDMVREIHAQGTTIILVEQSVNIALALAQTAYFMEKGEIRFQGPTVELLDRPDILRSVFLEGAASIAAPPRPESGNGRREPVLSGTAPRLRVRNVTKRFGGISAIIDVSFDVAAGEILGFVGPNGAGKTTLFDVLSGYLPADDGTVTLDGPDDRPVDVTRLRPAARAWLGLGRSFQNGRLFPALTVAEAIAVALERDLEVRDPVAAALHLPFALDSEAECAERVDELVELLGLGACFDKFVHELSTGTRRIVDLACDIAHRPSVLLLDEPSTGIAQREAEALGPLMLRIRDELGASILVIEHDVTLLRSMSDRLIALDLGEMIAEGVPDAVLHDPRVVAAYFGPDGAAGRRPGTLVDPTPPPPGG